jgi:hypothetical protein
MKDGLILHGDGTFIMVRGTDLDATVERAVEWAAYEDYVLVDPAKVVLEWIRCIPCPVQEHAHDGYTCDNIGGGFTYAPTRKLGRGAFRGVLAAIACQPGGER